MFPELVFKSSEIRTYRCSGRKNKHICNNKEIRREYIEAFVLDKLSQYVFDDSLIPKIVSSAKEYWMQTNAVLINKKEALSRRINELSKEISNLVTMVAKYASEEMAAKISELEIERTRLECEYKKICNESEFPDITEETIREKFELAKSLLKTGMLQTTKKLVELFINQVVVYNDHVEVLFNFHPNLALPLLERHNNEQTNDELPDKIAAYDSDSLEIVGIGDGNKTPLASTKLPKITNISNKKYW